MRYVAIEYYVNGVSEPYKGYLKIPTDFPDGWAMGFIQYLKDEKNARNVRVYPYKVVPTPRTLGDGVENFKNMEDDFILALRSNKYFPPNPKNQRIRRMWAMSDPKYATFAPKERDKYGNSYNPQ